MIEWSTIEHATGKRNSAISCSNANYKSHVHNYCNSSSIKDVTSSFSSLRGQIGHFSPTRSREEPAHKIRFDNTNNGLRSRLKMRENSQCIKISLATSTWSNFVVVVFFCFNLKKIRENVCTSNSRNFLLRTS